MSVAPLHPDFGRPEVRKADCEGGWLGNLAALADLARRGDMPQSRKLYAELCAAWRRTEGLPIPKGARHAQVVEAAWSALLTKQWSGADAPDGGR